MYSELYWIRVGPNPMTSVLKRKQRHRCTEGTMSCEGEGRDWSDASKDQERPRVTATIQRLILI